MVAFNVVETVVLEDSAPPATTFVQALNLRPNGDGNPIYQPLEENVNDLEVRVTAIELSNPVIPPVDDGGGGGVGGGGVDG